jgi:hypothetical protein
MLHLDTSTPVVSTLESTVHHRPRSPLARPETIILYTRPIRNSVDPLCRAFKLRSATFNLMNHSMSSCRPSHHSPEPGNILVLFRARSGKYPSHSVNPGQIYLSNLPKFQSGVGHPGSELTPAHKPEVAHWCHLTARPLAFNARSYNARVCPSAGRRRLGDCNSHLVQRPRAQPNTTLSSLRRLDPSAYRTRRLHVRACLNDRPARLRDRHSRLQRRQSRAPT